MAIKNTTRCRWHSISPRSIKKEKYTLHEGEDFNFEINLLKKYLNSLMSHSPKKLNPKEIKLQISLIEQIRKLVSSLSDTSYRDKINSTSIKFINVMIDKIVGVINKHVIEKSLKNVLSKEIRDLKFDDDHKDINLLLKTLTSKKRK